MSTPISYLTQTLLNYYDETDIRVRTYPFTIAAQLFNLAANALEDLSLRYSREVNARFLETTPIQLDNQGVYYGARLPNTFVPPPVGSNPPLNVVQGQRSGVWTTLQPYDDRVPVPTRITVDTSRSVVPFTTRSEEQTSELQSLRHLVCRLL